MSTTSDTVQHIDELVLPAPGSVIDRFDGTWRFLSNFYPWPLRWEGIEYPTAEHAYQAGKTDDLATRLVIAGTATPKGAKLRGRRVTLRDGWEDRVRTEVMIGVLHAKFTPYRQRVRALLDTRPAVLIEGNHWHDQTWGNCTCGRPACRPHGENRLGILLMMLRDELAERVYDGDRHLRTK